MSVQKTKKAKDKQKKYVLTESKLNKLMENVRMDMLQQSMLLFAAYLMEEPDINCDEDKIIGLWDGISRYSEAIDDHLITIGTVCNIIKDHTGMEIRWHKKPYEM